jgi:hypothetical protein
MRGFGFNSALFFSSNSRAELKKKITHTHTKTNLTLNHPLTVAVVAAHTTHAPLHHTKVHPPYAAGWRTKNRKAQ